MEQRHTKVPKRHPTSQNRSTTTTKNKIHSPRKDNARTGSGSTSPLGAITGKNNAVVSNLRRATCRTREQKRNELGKNHPPRHRRNTAGDGKNRDNIEHEEGATPTKIKRHKNTHCNRVPARHYINARGSRTRRDPGTQRTPSCRRQLGGGKTLHLERRHRNNHRKRKENGKIRPHRNSGRDRRKRK